MKKYSILTSFMCLLFAYACNDTTFDEYTKTRVEENVPASVVLDFSALENQVQTRATSDEASENAVHNLYVFVFNSNSTKASGQYFGRSELSGTTFSIDTYSGSGKQIFAVANFELNGMMSLTKTDLDNIASKEELMNLNAHLLQKITSRGSSFLMTGCIESNGQPKNIDIAPGNNPTSLGKINLRRVDAKVQFNIQAVNGAEFTLKEWKVEQLPLNVALFNQTENRFEGNDNFSTEWKKPEGEGVTLGKTFSFYVLEHLRGTKTKIESADPWTAYALREKNPFNWLREGNTLPAGVTTNDKYVFAHDRATYVVLTGHIKYMKGTEPVEGDVTYTIHLGYFDPVEGNKANDYKVKRNSFYTYNIKIASAERVLV
ncbi:MAG: fimbrial protein, partial [Bacteroidales bacterium]